MKKIKPSLIYFLLGSVFLAGILLTALHYSKSYAQNMTIHKNLNYVENDESVFHKLDLYLPEKTMNPSPVVIWIHGGAWMMGDKEACPASLLLQKQIAVASINYRLSSEAPFPAQIQDCKAAVRFIRANANKYHLNPNAIGVWGHSAGGHLVALLGLPKTPSIFEGNNPAGVSSSVQAVCDYAGPSDLFTIYHKDKNLNEAISLLFANKVTDQALKEASPVAYVSKEAAPFLIVHGTNDKVVSIDQAKELYDALSKAGAKATFSKINGGEHNSLNEKQIKEIQGFFNSTLNQQIQTVP